MGYTSFKDVMGISAADGAVSSRVDRESSRPSPSLTHHMPPISLCPRNISELSAAPLAPTLARASVSPTTNCPAPCPGHVPRNPIPLRSATPRRSQPCRSPKLFPPGREAVSPCDVASPTFLTSSWATVLFAHWLGSLASVLS